MLKIRLKNLHTYNYVSKEGVAMDVGVSSVPFLKHVNRNSSNHKETLKWCFKALMQRNLLTAVSYHGVTVLYRKEAKSKTAYEMSTAGSVGFWGVHISAGAFPEPLMRFFMLVTNFATSVQTPGPSLGPQPPELMIPTWTNFPPLRHTSGPP